MPTIPEVKLIPVEKIKPNSWNPNTQTDVVFNALVENIAESDFLEPILVVPDPRVEGEYMIISGEHRWQACKVLGYTEIPAIVKEDFDEDMQKFQTIRMNVLKGRLDPVKFTRMFDDLAAKYGEEVTKAMMAFVDEKAFKDVYMNVKTQLPKDMQQQLDNVKDEIKTIDDLSRILNELFSKHGDTLDQNFMVFTFGGKTHLWVIMDQVTKKLVTEDLIGEAKQHGFDMNVFFANLLRDHMKEEVEKLMKPKTKDAK